MDCLIFLDCEYNEHCGDLISIALVCASDGNSFYEVLHCANPTPWVAENVMPILGKAPLSRPDVAKRLSAFLMRYESVIIQADWPEDIAHFCMLMITSNKGQCIQHPKIDFKIRDFEYVSAIPHNALEDAKAMRAAWST